MIHSLTFLYSRLSPIPSCHRLDIKSTITSWQSLQSWHFVMTTNRGRIPRSINMKPGILTLSSSHGSMIHFVFHEEQYVVCTTSPPDPCLPLKPQPGCLPPD